MAVYCNFNNFVQLFTISILLRVEGQHGNYVFNDAKVNVNLVEY